MGKGDGRGDGKGEGPKTDKFNNYLVNEGQKTVFTILWAATCVTLFFITYFRYKANVAIYSALGEGVTIARGAAATLNLNCALILLPVCRNFVTWLRGTFVHKILPLDFNIRWHKVLAWSILFGVCLHALAHYHNFLVMPTTIRPGTTSYGLAWGTVSGATGHILVVVMMIMYTSALERMRRLCFELFWYSHHLFIVFFGLLLFHGSAGSLQPAQFWAWGAFSLLFYSFERSLRIFRANQTTTINRIVQHPAKVMELQMRKTTFKYKAGQYLFFNCQAVARYEWHPFTITSAPEEDYVSIHVRVVGDFTQALAKLLGLKWDKDGSVLDQEQVGSVAFDTLFRIDGPFGSASEEVFDYEAVMLVGAGIGVTPFASILKSVWYRINNLARCKLQKVYFVWICRDKGSFEWFSILLSALEAENLNNFLDIRIYLTAALKIEEVKQIFYNEEDGSPDVVSGLQAPTYYGRPNFQAIFQEMHTKHPDCKVGVFLCGPKAISSQLRHLSVKYTDTRPGGTRFVYNKENF